ncbi:hypothetical protein JD844_008640 [Phrynosoma platyrhinos]|uniref:WH2 domain-containing protein n=1 Tax=Phrynosoma platyrhinos TaxID=52577 RepID=A0ABQ7TE33_PHRPL|nr:hypothetical protein JD844_008640 [Phrynosoma platyrhinos]
MSASFLALEETLEADWVAVRPQAFQERERHKFAFIVAWNEIEGKFAITCHNRTAQRQRSGSRELRRGGGGGGGSSHRGALGGSPQTGPPPPPPPPPAKAALRKSGCSCSCSSSPGSPSRAEVRVAEAASPSPRSPAKARLRPLCSPLEEMEVLDLGKEEEPLGLLEKHKNTESMVELLELYQMEDEAYSSLAEATTELYQYLLQPFRDMRELAMLRRQQIKSIQWFRDALTALHCRRFLCISLFDDGCNGLICFQISIENDYLGPRRIESLQKEDADWQRKAQMAVLSIQDLTVKYFEITAKAQKAVCDRMRADQKKFGKAAWAVAVERMEKLQYAVSKETLQLMRAKEICLEQKKHALKEEMQSLQGGTEAIAHLDQLEADYYDLQLQLYEVQFEILKCEELLLTAQLESIKRLISEKREEVVYYDTYESMEAMLEKEDMATSIHLQREELQKLQQKVRQLEARRGRISAKKAYLRNKKEICIAKHSEKFLQHFQSEEELQHTALSTWNSITMNMVEDVAQDTTGQVMRICLSLRLKRERLQDEEERKNSWVSQERQKTLDRLRTFKQRYPGQVILKSTRLRLAHARRKSAACSTPCAEHSLSSPVTMQTDKVGQEKLIQPLLIQEPKSLGQLEDTFLPPCGLTSEFSQTTSLPTLISDELHPDAVQEAPLPPPPLPPPPPPPLPIKEESTQCADKSTSPIKQDSMEKPSLTIAPSAHFFDSSQLVSAKKKLKKTGDLEGIQRRRVSSPMDEVLASLKRGSFHLRKVEQRNLPPFPDEDDSNNILAQIRKGVKLKKVQKDIMRESFTILPDDDPLTRSIHEALRRIKEASPESEDEEENLPCTDWEN